MNSINELRTYQASTEIDIPNGATMFEIHSFECDTADIKVNKGELIKIFISSNGVDYDEKIFKLKKNVLTIRDMLDHLQSILRTYTIDFCFDDNEVRARYYDLKYIVRIQAADTALRYFFDDDLVIDPKNSITLFKPKVTSLFNGNEYPIKLTSNFIDVEDYLKFRDMKYEQVFRIKDVSKGVFEVQSNYAVKTQSPILYKLRYSFS